MSRVTVIGAGAIGGLLGALLHEAEHDVHLVVRPHSAIALRHGIRVEGGAYGEDRVVRVPAATVAPGGAWTPDLVLLAVKTQDLASAIAQHKAALANDAPVVALQNGLAQDDLVRKAVGDERWVAAITALDASMLDDGVVACDRQGALVVGPRTRAADAAAAILDDAITVERADDVKGARWTKLLVNLGNVIPALTGLPLQQTSRHRRLGIAHARLIKEGVAVARAERVKPAPLPYTSPLLLRAMAMLPDKLAASAYARRAAQVLGTTPYHGSTWQSIQRGRAPETEWLNGEIARRGTTHRIPTPVNARAAELAAKGGQYSAEEVASVLLGA